MSSQLRIAAFALAWAFTPAGAQTGLSRPLTIAVSHTPLSLPLYVAEAEGFLAAAAVKAKLIDCTGGHRCLKLLFDGEADLATASDSAPILVALLREVEAAQEQYRLSSGEYAEDPAVLRALFGVTVPTLDSVFDGLADYLEQHFEAGVLQGLLRKSGLKSALPASG